jgi:hypothetical protein
MSGYATPEDAVHADVPARYARVVAVEYAPGGEHAVVFTAYNEPPDIEPYVSLFEKTDSGWVEVHCMSGGDAWMSTSDDDSLGVDTTWEPPTARWNTPVPDAPEVPAWDEPEPDDEDDDDDESW